tara:strand:- start:486 stop:755 length:270 start_codon:yes stop_codon:yes gene_type:complete
MADLELLWFVIKKARPRLQTQLVVLSVSMMVRQFILLQALELLPIPPVHLFLLNMFVLLVADQVVERIMVVAVVLEDTLQEALLVQQVQ